MKPLFFAILLAACLAATLAAIKLLLTAGAFALVAVTLGALALSLTT